MIQEKDFSFQEKDIAIIYAPNEEHLKTEPICRAAMEMRT